MEKTIAVDKRFRELRQELEEKGYKVVDLFQYEVPVDACIYYDSIRDFHNANYLWGTGVLMINGKGKSAKDIEFMINRGVYTSLF